MKILAAKRASLKALNPFLVKSQPLFSVIKPNRKVAIVVSLCVCAYLCADCKLEGLELPLLGNNNKKNHHPPIPGNQEEALFLSLVPGVVVVS